MRCRRRHRCPAQTVCLKLSAPVPLRQTSRETSTRVMHCSFFNFQLPLLQKSAPACSARAIIYPSDKIRPTSARYCHTSYSTYPAVPDPTYLSPAEIKVVSTRRSLKRGPGHCPRAPAEACLHALPYTGNDCVSVSKRQHYIVLDLVGSKWNCSPDAWQQPGLTRPTQSFAGSVSEFTIQINNNLLPLYYSIASYAILRYARNCFSFCLCSFVDYRRNKSRDALHAFL